MTIKTALRVPLGDDDVIANEYKRNGLALFVLSHQPEQLTAKAIKEVAAPRLRGEKTRQVGRLASPIDLCPPSPT